MGRKKIIIFGATGNVGSYVTLYALNFFDKEKYEVITSGRRKTDFWEKQGVRYFSIDITKQEDFDKLPQENVHAVIDLAAEIPSYPLSKELLKTSNNSPGLAISNSSANPKPPNVAINSSLSESIFTNNLVIPLGAEILTNTFCPSDKGKL